MLTPTDFWALVSAFGGSAYGAITDETWPNTKLFKFIVGLQTSLVFVVAFATMDYLREAPSQPGTTPGVKWTESLFTTALPVMIYLMVLLAGVLLIFHIAVSALNAQKRSVLETYWFPGIVTSIYLIIGYHTLTIEITPVSFGAL